MTDKELKKLSRFEILELLLASEKQNSDLEAKLAEERKKVEELTEKLNQRTLDIQEAGSIADAAMKVSGIFQCAQAAADNYLENIRSLSGRQTQICAEMEEKSKAEAERVTREAQNYSTDLISKTESECSLKQDETEKYCQMLRATTERECMEQREKTASDCQSLRTVTDQYCENLRRTTEDKCSTMEAEISFRCDQTKAKAKAEMESYWSELSGRMEEFYTAHEGMREMLSFFNMKTPDFSGGKI